FLPYRLSILSNLVSQGLAQIYQQRYRLSVPEWRAMAVLGRYPGLTASQLGERTVMDKVTVSRAVNSLLKRKLLQRMTDSSDRRKRPLQVSDGAGQKLLRDLIPLAMEYQAALRACLSDREQIMFESLLHQLLDGARQLSLQGTPDRRT
ncbi:MAG: MarR family winged helix-turn-helix transcriptional regulator, partial [Lysobacterales bacterium]